MIKLVFKINAIISISPAMYIFYSVMHIVMNLIIQIFLGIALELVHCWWRVALVYIAGVVAGSMATSLTTPSIFLAGASGGVYALITAHIATIILVITSLHTLFYNHITDKCLIILIFIF